jgi:hypothetical protein
MGITLVELYQTRYPFALLDGKDAKLGRIAEAIFDAGDGHLDPDLDEQLERLAIGSLSGPSVRLTPRWRSIGLGALLAGRAIRKLSGGAGAVVCYPAPLSDPDDHGHDDDQRGDEQWEHAVASLQRVWGRDGSLTSERASTCWIWAL